MFKASRAKLAQRSFDYQWSNLPAGEMMLSDPDFENVVDDIISTSELRLPRAWFPGKRVLDAGCGQGRWIEGFLRLGANVTALDMSSGGLDRVKERYGDRVEAVQGDILSASATLNGRQFDLVWSWGVLHHTGDVPRGVHELARLVAPEGFLYLYLYGKASVTRLDEAKLAAARVALGVLPLRIRHRLLERIWGAEQAHQKFDLLSTAINERFTFEEAAQIVREAGFSHVLQTIPHGEVFLRADRGDATVASLPPPSPPFWFERVNEKRDRTSGYS